MKWVKDSKKIFNLKKNIPILLVPISLLILVILLLVIFFNFFFNKASNASVNPVKYLEINESFSGQLYFNNEMGESVFSDVVTEAIDRSKTSIELAVYSMNDTRIRNAIYEASKRGVAVTLIFSDKRQEGHDQVFAGMPASIKRQDVDSTNGSMHHKFLLIDRGAPDAKLFFGSYNFTYLQERYDPCFLLETTRPEIITVFGEEFDRLRGDHHGPEKLAVSPNPFAARIKYPEGFLEIWFSPQPSRSGLRERMVGLIKGANDNIKVMIWNFTSRDLAADLAVIAQQKKVRIITDDTNYDLPGSAITFLLAEKAKRHLAGLEIITDAKRNQEVKDKFQENNLNSFLHHHLLLVDDRVAVFGTNNWSNNGFYSNDESIMISDISSLVTAFKDSWEVNYQKNR